jgi:hypothetical protein
MVTTPSSSVGGPPVTGVAVAVPVGVPVAAGGVLVAAGPQALITSARVATVTPKIEARFLVPEDA